MVGALSDDYCDAVLMGLPPERQGCAIRAYSLFCQEDKARLP
ncbi:hypothetical protein EC1094V2_5030 (plasmid) [Escherichia coli]|nr:hypothetical protein EC1094V2_5008 [Escherichia coli]SMZ42966.1 hypothetical protein EC1094V2_5030 [Escherichia coli]